MPGGQRLSTDDLKQLVVAKEKEDSERAAAPGAGVTGETKRRSKVSSISLQPCVAGANPPP